MDRCRSKEKGFKEEGRVLDFRLKNWVAWCCHLQRGKTEGEKTRLDLGHNEMSRRNLSVNVSKHLNI